MNARLVDVRSGLLVQTAKFVARSPQEMLQLLPQLANLRQQSLQGLGVGRRSLTECGCGDQEKRQR